VSGCALFELTQRVGVDRDVQAHLGAISGGLGVQRLNLVEEVVELV
jgi:hypothetical protein